MSELNITELVPLLSNQRTDVRLQALQIAAQIVNTTNVVELCEKEVFSSIISALDVAELRLHGVTLISNILADEGNLEISQTKLLLERMIDFLTATDCQQSEINLYLILLTNLTIAEDMCEHFINHCAKLNKTQALIDQFLAYNPQAVEEDVVLEDYSESDVWQYFSSVLCNLCRLETGRRLLLAVTTGNMQGCLKQFRSKNPIRRRGVVACVRSCLFNADIHWWMVNEMKVIPVLLLPLVTETEFTESEKQGMDPLLWMQGPNKKPDPETDIQKMLLECLQLLGQKRAMREEMRKQKVYPICRNLDYLQDDEDISSIIYEIVQLTMGEEDPNTPVDDVQKKVIDEQGGVLSIEDSATSTNSNGAKIEAIVESDAGKIDDDEECNLDGVD